MQRAAREPHAELVSPERRIFPFEMLDRSEARKVLHPRKFPLLIAGFILRRERGPVGIAIVMRELSGSRALHIFELSQSLNLIIQFDQLLIAHSDLFVLFSRNH